MPVLTRKEQVVIVDAYSGGRYLIPAFQALGYPVIHVQSGPVAFFARDNDIAAQRADSHLANDHDVNDLARILRAAPAGIVLAGSEGGVLLADQLADMLDLPFRNDIRLSVARRDKFEMQEQLRRAGLAAISQARVSTRRDLDVWLAQHNAFPVVVKPLRSAGTDGVFICSSTDEARTALDAILARPDMFGSPNEAAVCQEFLVGHEYVLNGVACRGHYAFTEGWRSDKTDNNGFRVYDTQYLFCAGDAGFDKMSRYVQDVCRSLGIVNGPFHAEVMLTSAGPVLIEIGARIAGGADPYFIESCLGHSQVSQLVAASLHPDAFLEQHAAQRPTTPRRRPAYVYLIAESLGFVHRTALDEFLRVSGVVHVDYHYAIGEYQEVTRDLLTAAGVVIVTADNEEQLEVTVRQVREAERAMYAKCINPVSLADTGRPRHTAANE